MNDKVWWHTARDATTNKPSMLVVRGDAHGMTIDIGAYHSIVIDFNNNAASVWHWQNGEMEPLGSIELE